MPPHAASNRILSFGRRILLPAVALVFLLAASRLVAGEPTLGQSITTEIQRIFEENRKTVVRVRAKDSLGVRLGSGFFIDPSGTIYTHAGIVMNADDVTISHNGRSIPAQVVAADERSGIALLKTSCISPFVRVGDSDKVNMATPVIAIGFPEELEASPSFGIIAGRDRQHLGQYFSTSHLRANMTVHRGQGGSPVLNLDGEVIGILVARLNEAGSCHILPIRAAEKVRQDIARFGELRPGWVGVEVEDAPEAIQGSTAKIATLSPLAPADGQGLQTGDMVLAIGGHPVTTSEDVLDAAYFLTAGEPAEVQVSRNGKTMTVAVKPMIHPRSPAKDLHVEGPAAP